MSKPKKRAELDGKCREGGAQAKSSRKRDEKRLEDVVAELLRGQLLEKSFAKLSGELGISKGMLSRYVEGSQSMTLATLQKIQSALNISLEKMLGKEVVRKMPLRKTED